MRYSNSDGIEVSTTVNVSWDDIKDSADFDDVVSAFEPDADDLLKHVDFDDALKFVVEDPQFAKQDCIDALMEGDEIREAIIAHMQRCGLGLPPEVKVIEETPLFKRVTVGATSAVIVGNKVRFKHADHDEVHEFTCADSGMALNLLQGLAMVQS